MDKNNLIKDTMIFGNMVDLMRKATNKAIAKCSDIIKESEGEIKTGSDFYASTLSSMLGLPKDIEETPVEQTPEVEEPVTEEETTEETQETQESEENEDVE